MTLKKQIYIGFGATILLISSVSVFFYFLSSQVNYAFKKVMSSNLMEQQLTDRLNSRAQDMYLLAENLSEGANENEIIAISLAKLKEQLEYLEEATEIGEELAQENDEEEEAEGEEDELEAIEDLELAITSIEEKWAQRLDTGYSLSDFQTDLDKEVIEPIEELYDDARDEFMTAFAEIEKMQTFSANAVKYVTILAGIFLMATAVILGFGLGKPIGLLAKATDEIRKGNFDFNINYKSSNDLGRLAHSFNVMSDHLKETMMSRDLVDRIIDSMGNGIFVLDNEGRINRMNRKILDLLGFEEADLRGRQFDTLTEEPLERTFHNDSEGNSFAIRELDFKRSDDTTIPFSVILTKVRHQNEDTDSVVVLQDMRAFRESQRALKNAKVAAEKANDLKTQFLTNVSHEIRTPMNGVVAMADLLMDTSLNEEQSSFVRTIVAASNSMMQLINEILDFSKIEAGKMDLSPETFSLHPFLEETISMFSTNAHAKGLELVLDIDSDVPSSVTNDPVRLRQVLINLLGNAVKFTDYGEVALRVRNKGVDGDRSKLLFEVMDTGTGIAKEDFNLVFESFSQVDGSLTRKQEGTGLGVPICVKLLEMMGSELKLESQLNRGSCFYFELELESKGAARLPKSVGSLAKRCLVVEQSPTVGYVVERFLKHRGYESEFEMSIEDFDPFVEKASERDLVWIDGVALKNLLPQASQAFAEILKSKAEKIIVTVKSEELKDYDERLFDDSRVFQVHKPIFAADIDRVLPLEVIASEKNVDSRFEELKSEPKDAGLNVLVVDDNAINLKVAKHVLKKGGHIVTTASSGESALKEIGKEEFDVVLMDIQMPQMDGFEATRRLREMIKESDRKQPVAIACTAHAIDGYREECLAHQLDGYITKPLNMDSVSKELERIFKDKTQTELN